MEFYLPAVIAFLVTVLFTPLTIKLANKFKLLDNPKLRPHPAHTQKRIVPRAGGLAPFLGIALSMLIFIPFENLLQSKHIGIRGFQLILLNRNIY
jgi:UDP-GlcNAc:undecaprenyl-phosphate GlcNAc-1-phosphate transferase